MLGVGGQARAPKGRNVSWIEKLFKQGNWSWFCISFPFKHFELTSAKLDQLSELLSTGGSHQN